MVRREVARRYFSWRCAISQPMLNPKTLLAFSLIAVLTHQFSAATQRELPGPDAPTRVAEMHQTFEFLLGRAPPPDHWAIRDNTSFTDSWSLIGQGKRNKAYRSRVRLSKEAAPMPVVVKTSHHRNVSWFVTENSHPRSTADWPHFPKGLDLHGAANELIYVEFLRGWTGVPELLGGYIGKDGFVLVVRDIAARDVARRLPSNSNKSLSSHSYEQSVFSVSEGYERLTADRPVEVALAILECFRSFSEVGGYFLQDFAPRQFVFVNSTKLGFMLVDAPIPYSRWVANLLRMATPATLLSLATPASSAWLLRQTGHGYSGHSPRPVPACRHDADCPASMGSHCCCNAAAASRVWEHTKWTGCGPSMPAGAPEARGLCEAVPNSTQKRCSPLTAKTHVFDVATKEWLLPLAAKHSSAVESLLPLMTDAQPTTRLSFSDCIAYLERYTRSRRCQTRACSSSSSA